MVIVIATIQVKAGMRGEFLSHFGDVVPLVRAEAGCLEYGPHVDVETMIPAQGDIVADRVVVLEKWETLDDLEAHLIASHMLEYRKRVKDLVVGVELQVLGPAESLEDEGDEE